MVPRQWRDRQSAAVSRPDCEDTDVSIEVNCGNAALAQAGSADSTAESARIRSCLASWARRCSARSTYSAYSSSPVGSDAGGPLTTACWPASASITSRNPTSYCRARSNDSRAATRERRETSPACPAADVSAACSWGGSLIADGSTFSASSQSPHRASEYDITPLIMPTASNRTTSPELPTLSQVRCRRAGTLRFRSTSRSRNRGQGSRVRHAL